MKSVEPAYETVGIPISQLPKITVLPMVPRDEDPAISRVRLAVAKGRWARRNLKKHAKKSGSLKQPTKGIDKVAFAKDAPGMTVRELAAKYELRVDYTYKLIVHLGLDFKRAKKGPKRGTT